MHRTIFDTPGVNTVLRWFSIGFLKATGWKIQGQLPANGRKSVLIAAPHTSNWDLPYTLMVAFALRLNVYWMGKQSIFKPPFRGVMLWLGGIPIQRESSNNVVEASIAAIQNADGPVQLIVPPEGTPQQSAVLENGFLLHCLRRQRSHRDGLYGLCPQRKWLGPGV